MFIDIVEACRLTVALELICIFIINCHFRFQRDVTVSTFRKEVKAFEYGKVVIQIHSKNMKEKFYNVFELMSR